MPKSSREWYSPPEGVELVESLYGGNCVAPLAMPLLKRRGGFPRRVDVFTSDGAAFGGSIGTPEALAVDPAAYLERNWFPCGKCTNCVNYRKSRYERAALGFFRTSALTVLGTLTFSDRWFSQRVEKDHENALATLDVNLSHLSDEQREAHRVALQATVLPRRYNPKSERHFRDARAWLGAERVAMLKRLRVALKRRLDFHGAELVGRLEVMELGSRKGRLHLHLLWHFNEVPSGFVRTLKKWLKADWAGKRGVGFVDLHGVKDDEEAIYQLKYLGKFEDAGDRKLYVGSGNPVPQSNGYLSKGYQRWLSTQPEKAPDEALGNAQGEVPAAAPDGGAEILLWPSGRSMGRSHG